MENNKVNLNEDEIEIDLAELFFTLLHRIWIIIIATAVGGVIAILYTTLAVTPMYSSSSMIYIVADDTSLSGALSGLQASAALTADYETIVTSRPVVNQVINDLELDTTYEEFIGRITAENPTDTHILSITVEDEDPYMAKTIVDDLTKVVIKQTSAVMESSEPNIMQSGEVSQDPVSPSLKKNTAVGLAIGFILSVLVLSVLYIRNDTIKTQEDVEKYLGLNNLALIPLEEGATKNQEKRKRRVSAKRYKHKKGTSR